MKPNDQVYRWMTPCPSTVPRDATMAHARAVMRRRGVHHVPIVDEGSLVGIVSDDELSFIERYADPRSTTVGAVMTRRPYVVVPYAPLAEVAHEMATRRIGAAVVVDGGNVVGVFTAVDALRAIAEGYEEPRQEQPSSR